MGGKDNAEEANQALNEFIKALTKLLLCFYISDPPVVVDEKMIGKKIIFNCLTHEPLDGFIKAKEECIVILPPTHKGDLAGPILTKGYVLSKNYEIVN